MNPDQLQQKTVTVVSQPQLASLLGLVPDQTTGSTLVPKESSPPQFKNPEDQKVAQITYDLIRKLENQPQRFPSVTCLQKPDMQAALMQEVANQYRPPQLEIEGVIEKPNIAVIVAKTVERVIQKTIDIPRILVVPTGEVR